MKLSEYLAQIEREDQAEKWMRWTKIAVWVVLIFSGISLIGYLVFGDTISVYQYPDRTVVSDQINLSPIVFTEADPTQTIHLSVTDIGFDRGRYTPSATPGIYLTIYVNYSLPDGLPHSILSPKWSSNEVIDDSDHGTGGPFVGWYPWDKALNQEITVTMTELAAFDHNSGIAWFIPASIISMDTYFSVIEAQPTSFRALSVPEPLPVPELPSYLLILISFTAYIPLHRRKFQCR